MCSTSNRGRSSFAEVYAKIGRAIAIEAVPSVINFAGFQVGQVNVQTLRLINMVAQPTRVHVLVPQTPFFRIKFDKKGTIPAGMSEDITVEFIPTEMRYYQDSIRVHADGENLLVPIHAYPIMTAGQIFPQKVYMGNCVLGQSVSKTVFFENTSPLAFEFDLSTPTPCLEYTVHAAARSSIIVSLFCVWSSVCTALFVGLFVWCVFGYRFAVVCCAYA